MISSLATVELFFINCCHSTVRKMSSILFVKYSEAKSKRQESLWFMASWMTYRHWKYREISLWSWNILLLDQPFRTYQKYSTIRSRYSDLVIPLFQNRCKKETVPRLLNHSQEYRLLHYSSLTYHGWAWIWKLEIEPSEHLCEPETLCHWSSRPNHDYIHLGTHS